MQHQWDEDGCCTICDFDGAEFQWWKYHTYEGRASDKKMPPCVDKYGRINPNNPDDIFKD